MLVTEGLFNWILFLEWGTTIISGIKTLMTFLTVFAFTNSGNTCNDPFTTHATNEIETRREIGSQAKGGPLQEMSFQIRHRCLVFHPRAKQHYLQEMIGSSWILLQHKVLSHLWSNVFYRRDLATWRCPVNFRILYTGYYGQHHSTGWLPKLYWKVINIQTLLCFLQKRAHPVWKAPHKTYENSRARIETDVEQRGS